MKHKLLSVLLALAMALTILPASALAAGDGPVSDITPTPAEDAGYMDMPMFMSLEAQETPAQDPITEALGITAVNGVYTMNSDKTLTGALTVPGTAVIDLNGHTLTLVSNNNGIIVADGAYLTIQDSTANVPTVGTGADYAVTGYTGGKITSAGSGACNTIQVQGGGTLTVQSGMIENTKGQTIRTQPGSEKTATVSITGGYIKAQETAVAVMKNGNVSLTGGVVEGLDNFAVAAAGNQDTEGNPTQGNVTISITGGTLIGRIQTGGYASCGVYMPTSGNVTIGGSADIISTNGPGVVFRGGLGGFTVSGGKVTAMGTGGGKVGAYGNVTHAAVVLDASATHYPDISNARVKIAGGDFTSNSEVPVVLFARAESGGGESGQNEFAITGGKFSSNPFAGNTNITAPEGYKYDETTKTVGPDVTNATVAFAVDNDSQTGLFGSDKKAADLFTSGTATLTGTNVKVTGTANYISNWKAFSSDATEASGNYLPLRITVTGGEGDTAKASDLVQSVTVKGFKERTFTGEQFFGDKSSDVLVMQLNKLVGNAGLDNGHFQVTIQFKDKVTTAAAGDGASAGASITYDIDCTGVTLKLPEAPKGEVKDGEVKLEISNKNQVAADIANTINAAKAPNNTAGDPDKENPEVEGKAVTIPFDATSETGNAKAAVTLPQEVSAAMQGGGDVTVKAEIKADAATVTLSNEAVGKLSASQDTTITVEAKEKPTISTSGDSDEATKASTELAKAVVGGVKIEAKANNSDIFPSNSPLSDGGALVITVTAPSADTAYYVLYLNSGKFESMGKFTSGSDRRLPFKTKHLSEYYLVAATAENEALVQKLDTNPGAPADQKQLKLDITSPSNGLCTATVEGLTANAEFILKSD